LPTAADPGRAAGAQLRGVVMTPNFEWAPPHGVTIGQSDRETAAACSLGSTVARVVINWRELEPGPGQIDPHYMSRVDRTIAGLGHCGIRTELTIGGTPCWQTTDPPAGPGCTSAALPPRSSPAFGNIVAWSLHRWGPWLAALEVWNEPNNPLFWLGSVQQYVGLVNQAADAAHAIGSPVPILAGALAGGDVSYLSQMYASGMRGQTGISMHPYTMRPGGGFINPVRTYGGPAKKANGRSPGPCSAGASETSGGRCSPPVTSAESG
jgi:hypothetical protein